VPGTADRPRRVPATRAHGARSARLDEAAELLSRADRPVLVAGAEVARHGAVAELIELARRLGAPVVNEDRRTYERPGFPSSHANYAGLYDVRRSFIRESDLIVFVGCHCFTEFDVSDQPDIPDSAAVVHIHTDGAEIGAIYGVDVALVGDEQLTLARLLTRLGEGETARDGGRAAAARAEHLADAGPLPPVREDVENVGAVAAALADVVTDRTTVVASPTRRPPVHWAGAWARRSGSSWLCPTARSWSSPATGRSSSAPRHSGSRPTIRSR
jgi:benzoylformate decarboxylase